MASITGDATSDTIITVLDRFGLEAGGKLQAQLTVQVRSGTAWGARRHSPSLLCEARAHGLGGHSRVCDVPDMQPDGQRVYLSMFPSSDWDSWQSMSQAQSAAYKIRLCTIPSTLVRPRRPVAPQLVPGALLGC